MVKLCERKAILMLGSNIGNRIDHIKEAISKISTKIGRPDSISSVYETEPWEMQTENQFLNVAIAVVTTCTPKEILDHCLTIESEIGRQRTGQGYTDRIIDIDLITVDDLIIKTEGLELPHPRIELRKFVLQPLSEIEPMWRHPVSGRGIIELLANCPKNPKVVRTSIILAA